MNIYLLTRLDSVGYGECDAMIIIAHSTFEARELANMHTADEGQIWEDLTKVDCTCLDLTASKVVLKSFRAG